MSQNPSDKIEVSTATIIGMNAMIGAGIFALPSMLAQKVGPAGIISLILVATAVWFIAQSFARVAQLFPQEGSFYTYARQWGGHKAGLIASATYLIGTMIAMGLLTHAAGEHLAHTFSIFDAQTYGIATLITLIFLNMLGISLSELGQRILIICTVFPLIATTLICLTKTNITHVARFAPHGIMSIFDGARFAAFGFFGFEASASLFTIIKNPEKNLPKALTYSLIAVALLYIAFVTSLILSVPLHFFTESAGKPLAGPLQYIFPDQQWILTLIHLASVSAILGTLHSMIWSSGALLLAFFKKLRNHTTRKLLAHGILTNRTAILVIGILIYASFITLNNSSFFNLTAIFLLLSYMLSMGALLKLESEWKSGQNYITLAAFLGASIIAYFAITNFISSINL